VKILRHAGRDQGIDLAGIEAELAQHFLAVLAEVGRMSRDLRLRTAPTAGNAGNAQGPLGGMVDIADELD
jgi:hypothetical protein